MKTDSTATIKFTGLMGQNFVSSWISARQARPAEDGTVLVTTEQPDLSAIMAKLDNVASGVENLTKSFTGDKIDNLLGPFTDFLKANHEPLTATIANIRSISTQISQGKGTVGRLIYEDSLYNSALGHRAATSKRPAMKSSSPSPTARKVIDQVNAGQGTHRQTASKTKRSTGNHRVDDQPEGDSAEDQPGAGHRSASWSTTRRFYKNAKMTLQKLDKATEGLEDQGPLSVLGIAVTHLF